MRRVVAASPPADPAVVDAKAFGAMVRAARTHSGMTLEDAALSIGIAKQTLANLETGKSAVGLETALRAAHQFGVAIFAVPASQREPARNAIAAIQSCANEQGPSGAANKATLRRPG